MSNTNVRRSSRRSSKANRDSSPSPSNPCASDDSDAQEQQAFLNMCLPNATSSYPSTPSNASTRFVQSTDKYANVMNFPQLTSDVMDRLPGDLHSSSRIPSNDSPVGNRRTFPPGPSPLYKSPQPSSFPIVPPSTMSSASVITGTATSVLPLDVDLVARKLESEVQQVHPSKKATRARARKTSTTVSTDALQPLSITDDDALSPNSFPCPFKPCGMTFTSNSEMVAHASVHKDVC